MNILFPTDMSEASQKSFGAALDLARHMQCGVAACLRSAGIVGFCQ